MNSDFHPDSINDIVKHSPNFIKSWLNRAMKDINNDINWLGLAQATKEIAQSEISLEWSEISILIYTYIRLNSNNVSKESISLSEMGLRAYMISHLGPNKEHPILNPTHIINWFHNNIHISLEDVKKILHQINWSDIKTIKELRSIKNMIKIIKILPINQITDDTGTITGWIELYNKLP